MQVDVLHNWDNDFTSSIALTAPLSLHVWLKNWTWIQKTTQSLQTWQNGQILAEWGCYTFTEAKIIRFCWGKTAEILFVRFLWDGFWFWDETVEKTPENKLMFLFVKFGTKNPPKQCKVKTLPSETYSNGWRRRNRALTNQQHKRRHFFTHSVVYPKN